MSTVSQRSGRLLSLIALLMAGVMLGTCVAALAAMGPRPGGACGPGTPEEIGPAKAPVVGLWALAGPTVVIPVSLCSFIRLAPAFPSPPRLDLLWRDSASRAPPAS